MLSNISLSLSPFSCPLLHYSFTRYTELQLFSSPSFSLFLTIHPFTANFLTFLPSNNDHLIQHLIQEREKEDPFLILSPSTSFNFFFFFYIPSNIQFLSTSFSPWNDSKWQRKAITSLATNFPVIPTVPDTKYHLPLYFLSHSMPWIVERESEWLEPLILGGNKNHTQPVIHSLPPTFIHPFSSHPNNHRSKHVLELYLCWRLKEIHGES